MTAGPTLDWPGLMRAGMRDLRLLPDQFWQLTPSELALMLGVEPAPARMTRDRLADLLMKFPDAPVRAGVSVQPDGVTDGAE